MPQFAVPVAAEAAVATTMTAAEIAAAEAAAAQAAAAAEAAVIAETAQAAQAAQQAAQAAEAAQALQASQTASSGIQTLAQEVAGTQPTGIEQIFQQAQANNVPMSQAEFLNNSVAQATGSASPPLSPLTPTTVVALPAPPPIPQLPAFSGTEYLQNTMPGSVPGAAPPVTPAVPTMTPPAPPVGAPPVGAAPVGSAPVDYGFSSGLTQGVNAPLNTAQPSQYALGNQYGNYNLAGSVPSPAATATANPEPSGIGSLFNKGLDYAKQNPLTTLMGANTLYNYLNKPEPEEKKKYQSTFKSNLYSGYTPVQPTPYQPQYAVGGLADLGGYSDGGRMLKGPGDGMSDDIPATIAGKQPARLANEEFVIPADVVSHLGNGSSEAGAKQLYKMMDRIRKARTGTKKQGKQINPEKYLA
jgi:hypothetical protein